MAASWFELLVSTRGHWRDKEVYFFVVRPVAAIVGGREACIVQAQDDHVPASPS